MSKVQTNVAMTRHVVRHRSHVRVVLCRWRGAGGWEPTEAPRAGGWRRSRRPPAGSAGPTTTRVPCWREAVGGRRGRPRRTTEISMAACRLCCWSARTRRDLPSSDPGAESGERFACFLVACAAPRQQRLRRAAIVRVNSRSPAGSFSCVVQPSWHTARGRPRVSRQPPRSELPGSP
jgi:hypothetical protein